MLYMISTSDFGCHLAVILANFFRIFYVVHYRVICFMRNAAVKRFDIVVSFSPQVEQVNSNLRLSMLEINGAEIIRSTDPNEDVAGSCREGLVGDLEAEAELRTRASRRIERRYRAL